MEAFVWIERNRSDVGAHDACRADDFVDCGAASVKLGEKAFDAFFAKFAGEERGEEVLGLGFAERHARVHVGQERQHVWRGIAGLWVVLVHGNQR